MRSRVLLLCAAFTLVAGASAVGSPRWSSGEPFPPPMTAEAVQYRARNWKSVHAGGATQQRHILIQLDSQSAPDKQALAARGIRLVRPLGGNAFFATLDATRLQTASLAQQGVSGLHEIQRRWKLHPDLMAQRAPYWSVVTHKADGKTPDRVAVYVLLHADVDLASVSEALAQRHGMLIKSKAESIRCLVAELPLDGINALADEDCVQWVEPPLPLLGPTNDGSRQLAQVNEVQDSVYGLDGDGVTVMVYDEGTVNASHADFGGRVSVRDSTPTNVHATHVAGTIGGSGAISSDSGGTELQWRGMAPGVTMLSYGVEPNNFEWPYNDPGDLEADYGNAITFHQADIANNSIGMHIACSDYDCAYEGYYGVTSALIDGIVRGSLGRPFRVIWAGGNERAIFCFTTTGGSARRCGSEYNTTPPPACAKNHIAVGAVDSDSDVVSEFSSWGPADDGRLKPDIVAPGCQVGGEAGITSTDSNGAYSVQCGTSMAAPAAAGIGALLLQDFRIQFPNAGDFLNSTLKALLAHNAADIGNPGPDYQSGYGSVRAKDTIDFMRTGNFLEWAVISGQEACAQVIITEEDITSGQPLKVTLAWDDYPGAPNLSTQLINDLDVEVLSPSQTLYYPWTLDPQNPALAAVRTQADHINNIEQVVVDPADLVVGTWQVKIRGYSVPEGRQPFSLCISPRLVADCHCGVAPPGNADCDGNLVDDACQVLVPDEDSDTIVTGCDNCTFQANPDQLDSDGDGVGDACDNCAFAINSGQEDGDNDGLGDECDTPSVIAAVFRRTHLLQGDFAEPISILPAEPRALETRTCPLAADIVVSFSEPILGVDGLDVSDVSITAGNVVAVSLVADNELAISVQDLPNEESVTVGFAGIRDTDAHCVDPVPAVCFGTLIGDVNHDRITNLLDLVLIRDGLNTLATISNFRADVNADGEINILDFIIARNHVQTALPAVCGEGSGGR